MIVCICNKVNETQVSTAVRAGIDTLDKLEACLGVGNCCGKCKFRAHRLINENRSEVQFVDAARSAVSA